MRESHELIKTPTRLLVARKCTGRILLAVITVMVLFAFIAIVQDAQAEITEVRVAATRGWSNHRNRNVFYNGSRFFLLYHNNNEIYYKSSTDNITWSAESLLVSSASYTDFDIYLIDDTKFDLVYKTVVNQIYVRTYTISCGTLTTAGNSGLVVSAWSPQELFVGRSGSDRIFVVGRFNGYIRMYSADQTGDAENVTSWTLEKELKNTGATNMTMLPYQNEDKILLVYSKDASSDGVYARVAGRGLAAGSEYGPHQAGPIPEISSPIRISDTDFRVIIGPTSGNNAYLEEWKFNGSAWSYVATVDSSETDKYNPSLFYDRPSGDMYAFCFDLSGTNIIRHYKPSGGSWGAGVDVDGTFTPNTYAYPITQMHEPPPGSGRTVPRELVWAFKVPNATNYDLIVGNLRVASPAAPSVAGYTCYRTIRVDHNKISGTTPLTDFPLLVKFENDSNLATGTCGWVKNTDGWDIMFTDDSATPTVQYDHEIEKFDGAAGTLVAWVRIPSLSATAYTDLRMWYGKSGAADSSNPSGVWDCNYQGVWHLKEDPTDTAPQMKDSTSNANHGTSYGSMTSDDQVPGMIGGALEFDGSNDEIRFSSAMLGDRTAWTITAWMQTGGDGEGIYSEGNPSTGDYVMIRKDNYKLDYYLENPPYYPDFAGGTLDENFHHIAIVQTSKSNRASFVDGGSKTSNSQDAGTINYTTSSIGLVRTDWTCCEFSGIIDEVRISDVARSDEWIEAEYNNATDSSFYSVTYESCGAPHEDPNTFSCSRTIRVDHTKVSDLDGVSYYENFPMLVKFTGDNTLKFGSCGRIKQEDGSDIIFTDSNGYVLDHEIESYDGDTGTLVAWVKIPELYTGQATDITMHYGKDVLQCATENPTGVWDDDYVGVWHFKESSGTGSYLKNSKQDAYHADPDYSSPFVADAKIAGGRDVNQIDFDSGGDLFDGDTAFTLSFWGYPNYASDAEWQADEAHMFNTDSIWGLRWSRNSGNDPGTGWIQADVKFTSGTNYFSDWNNLLRAQWNHIVLNYNGSALRWYINGSMVQASTGYTGQALLSNSTTCLGYCWGGGGGGYVDELRYSRSARTAGWIATEYANQNDPASFYEKIDDTCESGGGGTYNYCKKIIIDRGNVSAPASPGYLADFPFLLKITNNNDLKNGVTSAEGWDIIFLGDSCAPLSHEIESYDPDTGSLVAWVKIPQLNGSGLSSDTVIYMKYGNDSVVCDNDDPPGVWDSNYVGVWHLKDLTTSSTKDSTSNSNDGTKKAANEPVEVDGYIEKAQNFGNDGSVDDHIDISTVSDDVDVDAGTFELWLKREFADSGGGGGGCSSVAIDGTPSTNTGSGSTLTISHTTGSGSDRLMLVAPQWNSGNSNPKDVTSVKYNDIPLTLVKHEEQSDDAATDIWMLKNPPTGTYNVVITYNAAPAYTHIAGVMTFTCVDQTTPLGTPASNDESGGGSSTASVAVSSAAGELVFATVAAETPDTVTWQGGTPEHWHIDLGSTLGAAATEEGAATVTMRWTDVNDHWAAVGVSIKPAIEVGTAPTMSIMRVDTDAENGITFAYDQEIEKFRFRHEAGNTEIKVERASSEIPQNTWTHAAMTWDKTADEFKAYINGSQVGSTQTGLGTWVGSVAYGSLGRKYDDTEYYDGSLDEARISDIARSAEWIKTAYDNQNNPESFITLGSCLNNTIAVEDQWEEKF